MPNSTRLPASTSIGRVRLRITSLERSLEFYTQRLGLLASTHGNGFASLSASPDAPPIIELVEQPGTRPRPEYTLGLYHFAVLYPDRASLATTLGRMLQSKWPFTGFADHGVSEAAYLNDPDGNGIELYVDRPREAWPRQGDSIAMYTRPLDVQGLLRAAEPGHAGRAAEVRIGHVHLHVSSLDLARMFYQHVLGFDVTANLPGALFLAAGGYHHHLGTNTWAGDRAQPANVAGLLEWELHVPDAEGRAALRHRLDARGIDVREADGLLFADPDGNVLRVTG